MFERAAAHDLEAQRRLLAERDRARLEEYFDPVPGLEAAAEAEHEVAVAAEPRRLEPLRRDGVWHDLDPGRLDTFDLEPPFQFAGDGEDPARIAEDASFDLSGQIGMRKGAEEARLLAQRRIHFQYMGDPQSRG